MLHLWISFSHLTNTRPHIIDSSNPFLIVIIGLLTMDLKSCMIHPCFGLREDLSRHVLRMRWMKVPEERLDVENATNPVIIGSHVRRDRQDTMGGPVDMEVTADPGPSDQDDHENFYFAFC
ncbi:unnamed protein product, partial [Cuscuta europaea]